MNYIDDNVIVRLLLTKTRMREIREQQGLSVSELARRTGIEGYKLQEIESKHKVANKIEIHLIAKALGVDPDEVSQDILTKDWRKKMLYWD